MQNGTSDVARLRLVELLPYFKCSSFRKQINLQSFEDFADGCKLPTEEWILFRGNFL